MDFITSDTHFGHANIIQYCQRPFSSVEEMDEILVTNWNSVVKPEDWVYHLGDFALGKAENVAKYRERLNGRIFLVRGNHDRPADFMLKAGFTSVVDRYVFSTRKRPVVAQHRPNIPRINPNFGLFYGHVHNTPHESFTEHSLCVCVELHEYKPLPLDEAFARLNL